MMSSIQPVPSAEELRRAGANPQEAVAIYTALRSLPGSADKVWRLISKELLDPDQPFELHLMVAKAVHAAAFARVDQEGYPPMWTPTIEGAADTNAGRFMQTFEGDASWQAKRTGDPLLDWPHLQMSSFDSPETFWPPLLKELGIRFHVSPSRVLQGDGGAPDAVRWLPDARLNIAESCVLGRDPDALAVVAAVEGSPRDLKFTSFGQLHRQICSVVSSLRELGFQPGDAVAICMPMTAASVALYLGIVWAGCAVVGIADSFAQDAIAMRLKVSGAAAMFTQDVIQRGGKTLPLYAKVAALSLPKGAIVIPADEFKGLQVELQPGAIPWARFEEAGRHHGGSFWPQHAHVADAYSVTNILFSSGTTGEPKAIPWTHITPIRCAADAWGLQDVRRGDVVVWPTNLGWMMGPWLIYAALLNGAAVGIYEGSPLERGFGEFVASARVTMLGLVPSIAKAWKSSGCMQGLDWGCVRCFSSSGEASNSNDYHWLMARAGYKPVIEYCGGTEIGGGFLAGSMLQPNRPGSFSTPSLGSRVVILNQDGQQSQHSPDAPPAAGELAIVPPMLGTSQRLLNRDHYKVYFEGMPTLGEQTQDGMSVGAMLRRHGDEVSRLAGGVYCAQGRCDDTMNLGGIKVSSAEIERACMASGVQGVHEVAAVGVSPPGGGPEALVLFCVAEPSSRELNVGALKGLFTKALKERLNPLFKVSQVVGVDVLPRTASNKVMRRVLRDQLVKTSAALQRSKL